jgi:hypothetical protein
MNDGMNELDAMDTMFDDEVGGARKRQANGGDGETSKKRKR